MEEPVHPGKEVFPVRRVGVSAIVLAPRKLPIEQTHIHRRHPGGVVVFCKAEILRAQQTENRLRRHRGHVAPLLI